MRAVACLLDINMLGKLSHGMQPAPDGVGKDELPELDIFACRENISALYRCILDSIEGTVVCGKH